MSFHYSLFSGRLLEAFESLDQTISPDFQSDIVIDDEEIEKLTEVLPSERVRSFFEEYSDKFYTFYSQSETVQRFLVSTLERYTQVLQKKNGLQEFFSEGPLVFEPGSPEPKFTTTGIRVEPGVYPETLQVDGVGLVRSVEKNIRLDEDDEESSLWDKELVVGPDSHIYSVSQNQTAITGSATYLISRSVDGQNFQRILVEIRTRPGEGSLIYETDSAGDALFVQGRITFVVAEQEYVIEAKQPLFVTFASPGPNNLPLPFLQTALDKRRKKHQPLVINGMFTLQKGFVYLGKSLHFYDATLNWVLSDSSEIKVKSSEHFFDLSLEENGLWRLSSKNRIFVSNPKQAVDHLTLNRGSFVPHTNRVFVFSGGSDWSGVRDIRSSFDAVYWTDYQFSCAGPTAYFPRGLTLDWKQTTMAFVELTLPNEKNQKKGLLLVASPHSDITATVEQGGRSHLHGIFVSTARGGKVRANNRSINV